MTISSKAVIQPLFLLFLVVAGLYFAKGFLIPLCVAGILATLFMPLCKSMENRKVPKAIAVIICLLVLLITIAGLVALLTWQINELTNGFSLLSEKIVEIVNHIQRYIFTNFGITPKKQSQLLGNEELSITGVMQALAGSLASIIANFILVLAYIFLFLYFRTHISRFILKLISPTQQTEIKKMLSSITNVSQQYLLGLTKMIVCLWIMYGIGFSLIGVKNALFFAILCGLLEIVPFIGNLTGTTLTVFVAVVQGAGLPLVASIIGVYMLVQLIQEWILSPLILGPQVKINGFTTIIALVVGELIWGIAGIFLAIPLIGMFKIVCDHIDSLKPYGFLIGEIENKKGNGLLQKLKNRFIIKRV
ncbi:MAG: AI-2E family transporter [Paludibacter sp.]